MVTTQSSSKRKSTGGRYKKVGAKRLANKGNLPMLTKLGEVKKKTVSKRGNSEKVKLASVNIANVYDKKKGKYVKAKIKNIVDSPANPNYIRRNIMTKGSVIDTDLGQAKVTSRPGQEGTVNAVLI